MAISLPRIPNGRALVDAATRRHRFDPEMTVSYVCDEGFSLADNDHVTCMFNGGWSKQRPLCQRIECGQPPLVDNGMVEVEVRFKQTKLVPE